MKGDQSWVITGRTDVEAETPILWPPDAKSWLIGKDPDAGKDWRQEEKGTMEDEMAGRHHWHNGHGFGSWWWTGRPGVLQFMGLQRVSHNWAIELNWTRFYLRLGSCSDINDLYCQNDYTMLQGVLMSVIYLYIYYILEIFFGHTTWSMWSSSPTRNRTHAPCSVSYNQWSYNQWTLKLYTVLFRTGGWGGVGCTTRLAESKLLNQWLNPGFYS